MILSWNQVEINFMNNDKLSLRREIKFVASEIFLSKILSWIGSSGLFLSKHYPDRIVNNIYFDTYDLDAYGDNLDGISERNKLRYRWYGNSLNPQDGNLELKKRKNAFGFKNSQKIKGLKVVDNHKQLLDKLKNSVSMSWMYIINHYCDPIILNRYKRSYYLSKDKKVRVTLDRNHSVFDQRLSNKINLKKKANILEYIVIEIKFNPDLIDCVSNMIKDIPMRNSRNSKYVNSVNLVL